MKKFKLSMVLLVVLLLTASFVQAKDVKITLVNSKGEIQSQLEAAAKLFGQENPGINLEIVPCGAGQSPYEKVVSMYASGNAPTLSMIDPGDVPKFEDKFMDLSSEQWASEGMEGALDAGIVDGKVLAFPLAIEGYAFIYNKEIVDKAVGGDFDPATINSTDALEGLFKNIEANTDAAALVVSPMDWSLAAHFLAIAYIAQDDDTFLDKMKEGKVDLANNDVFNGLIDTFDVMKEYNIDKNDPLAGTYDRGPELLGKGEVGIWFMGNWAWPNISEFNVGNAEYGFLPVPVSNNPADFGNSEIVKGSSKFIGIDNEQNSPEQKDAAKKFLNWLIYSDNGQDSLVNKMNIIPAFKSVELEPADPLANSIIKYMLEGKTMNTIPTMPADHWSVLGASMQKYLSDYAGRQELAKEIEEYWKNVD